MFSPNSRPEEDCQARQDALRYEAHLSNDIPRLRHVGRYIQPRARASSLQVFSVSPETHGRLPPGLRGGILQAPRPKDRISRIYEKLGKGADFSRGTLQQALSLFKMRNDLAHPRYVNKKEHRATEIPDIFDVLDEKFPPDVSKRIADETIDLLLREANLTHLRNYWRSASYAGPGSPAAESR
jgi:hypothetical protein